MWFRVSKTSKMNVWLYGGPENEPKHTTRDTRSARTRTAVGAQAMRTRAASRTEHARVHTSSEFALSAAPGPPRLSPGSTARQSITTGARQEPDSPDSPDTCQSTVPDTPDSKVGPHLDSNHVPVLSGGVRHVKQNPTARQPDSPTVAEQPDSSRQSSTVADSSTVRALDSGVYSYTSFLRART